jgi:hypothetical protein
VAVALDEFVARRAAHGEAARHRQVLVLRDRIQLVQRVCPPPAAGVSGGRRRPAAISQDAKGRGEDGGAQMRWAKIRKRPVRIMGPAPTVRSSPTMSSMIAYSTHVTCEAFGGSRTALWELE